jgi:ADP-heptose:LPS heptosyltransferase
MSAYPVQPFVIRHGRVGDMIMQTALLAMLHRRYGAPAQVIGAGPWNSSVFLGHPDVAHCWSLPRHAPFPFTRQWPHLVRALRASAPGPIYIAEYQYRQLPRVKRLLATSGIDPQRCVFIEEEPGECGHWVDALLRLGARTPPARSAADYPVPADHRRWAPRLAVLDHERRERDAWLRSRGWLGRPLVLLQPGNHRSMSARRRRRWQSRDDKAWPVGHWRELIGHIRARLPEAIIILRGARAEIPMLEQMRAAIGRPDLQVAGLELRPLFALIESAHSGPAHAAAALGLPVVVLYGNCGQGVWLPRSPTGSAVIGLGGPPQYEQAAEIPVQAALEAWCTLLRGRQMARRTAQAVTMESQEA